MFELEGIVGLVLLLLWIWALFDCISTDAALCRNLPKGVWLLLILFLADIGSIAWLLLGRPERAGWRPGSTDYASPRRPIGIEDHPGYIAAAEVTDRRSAELDERLDAWEAEQKRKALDVPSAVSSASPSSDGLDERAADLDRREQELRRRELELRERELDARERGMEEK